MSLFKKILAAVDGSAGSRTAFREACRLARAERAKLLAMCVAPRYEGDLRLFGAGDVGRLLEEPCASARRMVEGVSSAEGVDVAFYDERGDPAPVIVDFADRHDCDLVVMGAGRLARRRWPLLASVAAQTLRSSRRNLLLLPERPELEWQRVALMTDGLPSSVSAGLVAIALARAYGAILDILPIPASVERGLEHAAELERMAGRVDVSVARTVIANTVDAAVAALAKERRVEIVIAGAPTGRTTGRTVSVRTVASVLRRAQTAMLVVRTGN
ncbi:MAG: universal stress protein [Acidobacteriota bacterium]